MPHRLKYLELRNLSKPPTPLKSVNFRHTTPGSGALLVSKYENWQSSELIDPNHPKAHLPLKRRHARAPRWTSPHLTLYAFPKASLREPEVQFPEPYKQRPYPALPRRPEQRSADMSMQFLAYGSRLILRPTVRVKIKRRLREAVSLIVTRGAAVDKSRKGSKIVFRAEDVGAEKWIVPDWTYVALPTTEMIRMPFTELLDLMRQALVSLHQRIPEIEKALRRSRRQDRDTTSLVQLKSNSHHPSTEESTSPASSPTQATAIPDLDCYEPLTVVRKEMTVCRAQAE
ncbi:hypothetical protein DFH94DRAFT_755326 [Russula ochroleuca]|uniref:Uncharacterized protein n=1 Tax=Russula ochroleuca TaxID=152965 RepID=A0A9P5T5U7_9AGAM|nr:hypothetical protein DFH94DRAFT_755326 [Russula ochroleuca]